MKKTTFCLLFSFFSLSSFAQGEMNTADEERFHFGHPDSSFSLIRDSPVTIDLEQEEEDEEEKKEVKKKKRKKKVFYGIKTKKGFARRGYGKNATLELFYYVKSAPKELDPYVQDIYWYDTQQRKVRSTAFNPALGYILHGPYTRSSGDAVLEEGIYYLGKKHGRWMTYDKEGILLDKRKYNKGWPKESIMTYYDDERKKLKEVIPMVHDKKDGDYYYFHENGAIAIRGTYREDKKVGRWLEYYSFLGRQKKEIMYPASPYDEDTEPYINREWNRRSQLVYQKKL